MTDVKRIETYGLYEFCQEVQAAIKDGYSFDFESSENFPTAFGSLLVCGLIKAGKKVEPEPETEQDSESVAVTEQTEEVVQDEEQTEESSESAPAKRGPKPKVK